MNNITLEALGISKEQIVEKIVSNLTEEAREEITDLVASDIRKKVMAEVQSDLLATVKTAVAETCAKALDVKFQPLDVWGEAQGEPVTVREMFHRHAKEWWSQTVDAQGRPTDGYSKKMTRAEWHAAEAVKTALNGSLHAELEGVIKDARNEVSSAVSKVLHTYVTQHFPPAK
ncbi:MAG: hypothetical protein V4672_13130 [Verrucomicrobiota bacterium]